MTRVCVLGCTGSIGTTTFQVLRHLRQQDGGPAWQVPVMSAGRRVDDLVALAREWQPRLVCVADAAAARAAGRRRRR